VRVSSLDTLSVCAESSITPPHTLSRARSARIEGSARTDFILKDECAARTAEKNPFALRSARSARLEALPAAPSSGAIGN
jgi:hypothetical protein